MPSKEKKIDFAGANLTGLMLKFSIPCILSLLISSLYNIVDQMFIGNSSLSALGNAATGVVFPVFIIAQAFAWCFGDGCASYLNISQGRCNTSETHRAIGSSITVATVCGLLMIGIIYPLKEPILTVFGASENTLAYAIEYLDVVLLMMPVFILCNMLNSVIRASGSPLWAMLSMLAGAVVNIILDPVFIFSLDMGMRGAALATVIGQGASFVMTVLYFVKTRVISFKLTSFIPGVKATMDVVRLGASTFVTQLAIVIVAVLCNVQLAKYGLISKYGADIPIAIIGIESKIFTVVINIVVGIALGCQPIVSFNMGAKNYSRVRQLYFRITACAIAIGAFFTLIFELAPGFVIGLFGVPSNVPNPEDYWEFGEMALRIFLSLIMVSCLIKTNSIFFQAAGKPFRAVAASTIRDVFLFIPLILVLPLLFPSVETILFAAPISDLCAAVIIAILSVTFVRSLSKDRAEAAQAVALKPSRPGVITTIESRN